MTIIVKTVTRFTLGFILLYGIYIALNGHVMPGGGFAGGVIVALSFVHVMLAYGKEVALERLHSGTLRLVICAAAMVFLVVVLSRFGGVRRLLDSEITIPLAETVIVGAGLFAIFVALALLAKTDKDAE